MKYSNVILFILVFIITGETVTNIDKKFDPLGNAPKKIVVGIEQSYVKQKIENGSFIFSQDQFRVMVIGDSYIQGEMLDPSKRFSKFLQKNLDREGPYGIKNIILDVSRGSNNTKDNFNTFLYYYEFFKPSVVFWAYNINDILGVSELKENKEKIPSDFISKESTPPNPTKKQKSYLNKFKDIFYENSLSITFLAQKLSKELKLMGIVLPLGDFYYVTTNGYNKDNSEWIISQNIFIEVRRLCQRNNIKFILYKMPEFNLLRNNFLFINIDKSMLNFANANPYIHYIDGYKDFDPNKENEYVFSRYDGHPNEVAQKIIADKISYLLLRK